jgi:hypothetical protein
MPSTWPNIDITDYSALSRERGVLLGRLAVIEEIMREINGKDYPCTDPGGHADHEG